MTALGQVYLAALVQLRPIIRHHLLIQLLSVMYPTNLGAIVASSKRDLFEQYLSTDQHAERMTILSHMKSAGESIPFKWVRDLLEMNLLDTEKSELVLLANAESKIVLEDFLTRSIMDWSQDVAASALQRWVTHTDHQLTHRWLAASMHPSVPQRLRYAILNRADIIGGRAMVESNAKNSNLDALSSTFHALLLRRCVEWNVQTSQADALADSIFQNANKSHGGVERSSAEALCYLLRFKPEKVQDTVQKQLAFDSWIEFAKISVQQNEDPNKLVTDTLGASSKKSKKPTLAKLANWPTLWTRSKLSVESLKECLPTLAELSQSHGKQDPFEWHPFSRLLSGVSESTLEDLCVSMTQSENFFFALKISAPYLTRPLSNNIMGALATALSSASSPAEALLALPHDIRAAVGSAGKAGDKNSPLQNEKDSVTNWTKDPTSFNAGARWKFSPEAQNGDDDATIARSHFFDVAFRRGTLRRINSPSFWDKLSNAWTNPSASILDELTAAARKQPALLQLSYIHTLSRFKGIEPAALKLLDYSRSHCEEQIAAVLHALSGIGTTRALQDLVSFVTRPNLNISLRLEACQLLKNHDLGAVQAELRSATTDLNLSGSDGTEAEKQELLDSIRTLVRPFANIPSSNNAVPMGATDVPENQAALDEALMKRIPTYQSMSSEVKRALRTAEFFHAQVTRTQAGMTIDLSPLIDMQYKSLELTFREQFEDICNKVINQGQIQRRLDVIGYARPIIPQMDQFESFIAGLPVVSSIPFFSKFKMRKMLRSLCQFRPGKRFTLDGLKAFSIFFLCFSRQKCKYGLERMFPLPFTSDEDLAKFAKALHVFQDFRNRAAHEGFQPDARNNVDGIWQMTAEIYEYVEQVRKFFAHAGISGKSSSHSHNHHRAS